MDTDQQTNIYIDLPFGIDGTQIKGRALIMGTRLTCCAESTTLV